MGNNTRTTLPDVDARKTLERIAEAFGLTSRIKKYWKVEILCKKSGVQKTLGDYDSEDTAARLVELLNNGNSGRDIASLSPAHSQLVVELGALEGGVS